MKKVNRILLASSVALGLAACGDGSSGGSPSVEKSLTGMAIDGYISGATVFLDVNSNSKLDHGEPRVITGEDGSWELLTTGEYAECADYVPLVVDVPVGAIDSDYGEVTESYQMVYPPAFATATVQEIKNTTPLTTVVWGSIQKEFHSEGQKLTCDNVKANYALRERIKERLAEQEYRVAQRYNVTVDELYGDYIKSGNTHLHAMAAALVPSMKASYADTVEIESKYPDAVAAWVEYFNSEWDDRGHFADGWYKQTYLNEGEVVGWSTTTEAVSDNLNVVLGTVEYNSGKRIDSDGVTYEWNVSFNDNELANDCSAMEWVEQTTSTAYGVVNVFSSQATEAIDCINEDWSLLKNTVMQQLSTRVQTSNTNATSQHFFTSTEETGLGHLVMMEPGTIDPSEFDAVNFISTDFNDTNDYGAYVWGRILAEYNPSEGVNQITTSHDNAGHWSRTIIYTDGTYAEQCSFDSGNTWESKTGDNCEY